MTPASSPRDAITGSISLAGRSKSTFVGGPTAPKRRVRFRWRGFSTYLTGTPWSEDFMRQYAAALDGVKAQANVGGGRTIPGSFDALCVSSPEYRGLKASTPDPHAALGCGP